MADFYKSTIPIIDADGPATDLSHPKDATFGCVPRDYTVDPLYLRAAPSTMKVVPESDWDAIFDEQEASQSSLEHVYLSGPNGTPAFVNLDQNGDGFCHTADTEVLTDRGFVAWPDYNWTDLLATVNPVTHAMEFQPPFQKHVYDYDGPMVYSTNRRVDFAVTPDHMMYVRKWDERARKLSNSYSFVRAGDVGWYCGLLHAPSGHYGTELVELEIPGDRRYDGDDLIALLGRIVSDGYAGGTDNTRNWVSFAAFRKEDRDVVAAMAGRVGFHEAPGRPGVWIRYDAAALADWVRANCYTDGRLGSKNKRVPDIVKVASGRQIKLFLHHFNDRNRSGLQYYSSSRRLIDDLQELHLRIGKRSRITTTPPKDSVYNGKVIHGSGGYLLTVGDVDRLCLDKSKHLEEERYRGPVFCAAVLNHTLITRRNGSILISSNCWGYSTGHAIMLDRLRRNLSPVRLNPHSMASIIKGGRDEGGWCGLSGQFARTNGCAVEGTGPGEWPLHSRSLRYDTPALRAEMKKYRVTEDWYDMARDVWDQKMNRAQLATCGLTGIPAPSDFNWWGHSVCQVRWVRIERGSWGPLILNSWKGWGRFGLAVLRGNQATANGAIGVLATTAS